MKRKPRPRKIDTATLCERPPVMRKERETKGVLAILDGIKHGQSRKDGFE
jgi:hypothetical protein